ncbi:hypothetical protein KI387_014339, partial [Taxus chinensis]
MSTLFVCDNRPIHPGRRDWSIRVKIQTDGSQTEKRQDLRAVPVDNDYYTAGMGEVTVARSP